MSDCVVNVFASIYLNDNIAHYWRNLNQINDVVTCSAFQLTDVPYQKVSSGN